MSVNAKDAAAPQSAEAPWLTLMPGLFVVLWSTGFIGAKYGLPYASPLIFLALRFGIVALLILLVAIVSRVPWPASWRQVAHDAVVGLLIQGTYLGGVYFAVANGISAGLSALIVSLQPALTAALAGIILGEEVRPRQWAGVALGFVGVVLVVWSKLKIQAGQMAGLSTCAVALVGITIGTLYQKRFGGGDLRSATVIQNTAAFFGLMLIAPWVETIRVEWRLEMVLALVWLILIVSIGALSLFLVLLRRGGASRITSLLYLVPPVTALMAYFLFGETFGATALAGMVLTAAGVALVNR